MSLSSSHDRVCDRVCDVRNDSKCGVSLCLFGKIDCQGRNVTRSLYSTSISANANISIRDVVRPLVDLHIQYKANFLTNTQA